MPKATKEQQAARLKRWFAESYRKYGITEQQIRDLIREQGGACAICRRPFRSRIPCIDHDHETQFVRGILCGGSFDTKTCNRLIGLHASAQLRRAADYLDNPPAFAVIGRVRPGTMEKAS